jgi:ABC-type bacteriocin/lantibiotic exporter with double-glycine peptidase domain
MPANTSITTLRSTLATATSLAVFAALAACQHPARSGSGDAFEEKYSHFTYNQIDAVKQSSQKTCGAAALSSVSQYWKKPVTEPILLATHPPQNKNGYPILQLQRIAEVQGLQAFLLTPRDDPAAFLEKHIQQGRPVLIAIQCPKGRYFGKPLPLIERLDSQTLTSPGNKWKEHYVVVTGFSNTQWLVMDPAYGIVPVDKPDLIRFWAEMNYAALLCST